MTGPADTAPTGAEDVPRSLHPAIPSHPSEFACIDLINSSFSNHLGKGPPIDRLPLAAWQGWFLERHGLRSSELSVTPVDELAELREGLRRLLSRWAKTGSLRAKDAGDLDDWLSSATMRQRVSMVAALPAVALEPLTPDWTWVMAAVAASAVNLIARGAPSRLKVCANPECSWMFYDYSPTVSRRFCSTSPCASVVRVRRFRDAAVEAERRTRGKRTPVTPQAPSASPNAPEASAQLP